MRLAVSNIAWPAASRLAAYEVLAEAGIGGLEIAPGMFLAECRDPFLPDPAELDAALAETRAAGLELVSMQSLLFGVAGAALFDGPAARARLETGMVRAIDLAGRLGIRNLVFGSPKQRIVPEGMPMQAALDQAAEVFARLGDRAKAAGTVIAIEANPKVYGTNFLTHGQQALDFVRKVNHPAVGFVLDLGTMHINDDFDTVADLIAAAGTRLSHVHVSEPGLVPAPADPAATATVLSALETAGYSHAVSIEMKADGADPVASMAAAVRRLAAAQRLATTEGVSP